MITRESTLVENYFAVAKNRVFKILPLIEENNKGVNHYIESLLFELSGLKNAVEGVKDSSNYISLVSGLEAILEETVVQTKDFRFIRSEILRLVNLVGKLERGG